MGKQLGDIAAHAFKELQVDARIQLANTMKERNSKYRCNRCRKADGDITRLTATFFADILANLIYLSHYLLGTSI